MRRRQFLNGSIATANAAIWGRFAGAMPSIRRTPTSPTPNCASRPYDVGNLRDGPPEKTSLPRGGTEAGEN
ncbi:hypothetical protein [Bradyrhizobium sp.]|uniref:hypothetical protein n=1 Tax=Bradyrhizobium sp. TaxID=376 RepID=UPI0026359079|nr:hypothetical protein [Bradyrhizobium sp.]